MPEFAAMRQYPSPCRWCASTPTAAAGMRTGFRSARSAGGARSDVSEQKTPRWGVFCEVVVPKEPV